MTDGDDWESVRLEVLNEEARRMLEAQNETMADIDDKVMQSVRFNAVLIGLLLTAGRIAGATVFNGLLLHAALGSLVVSAIVGIATYGESNLYVGPVARTSKQQPVEPRTTVIGTVSSWKGTPV